MIISKSEMNFLSMVKYSSFYYYYWLYYEFGGQKRINKCNLTLVIEAIKRCVPSSSQRLSRAHEKGSQQIPVKTSLTYFHVIFPTFMSLKCRGKKDSLNLKNHLNEKIKCKLSDNWKKKEMILWIHFSDRMGIWVEIGGPENPPSWIKSLSSRQLLRYDSVNGPFMFSRFAFFFKKLPKHLLLSYKK